MLQRDLDILRRSFDVSAEILNSDFYKAKPRWISEAAFALVMIHLKDGLKILHRAGRRLDFTDDISEGDVTDLISAMRDAICHIGSPSRYADPAAGHSVSFCVAIGSGVLISGPTYKLENPYGDDVAFFYGRLRVLLRRHIHRSLNSMNEIGAELAQIHKLRWGDW